MKWESFFHIAAAIVLAPLSLAIVNRVKAIFAGRKGPGLMQPYYDLIKLFRKGAVYSSTTTWVFRLGPVVGFACVVTALLLLPLGDISSVIQFPGDFILLVYLLGLMRFVTVLSALDTGSSFEGMGASREVQFSTLVEPSFLLGFCALAVMSGQWSLSAIFEGINSSMLTSVNGASVWLVGASFLILLLTENSRIPVDDPNTHLELTMIHEVMVLDHSGVDFGLIQYGASIKFWIWSALIVGLFVPDYGWNLWLSIVVSILGIFIVAAGVGIIESTMARLRLLRVPQLLACAFVVTLLSLILIFRKGM